MSGEEFSKEQIKENIRTAADILENFCGEDGRIDGNKLAAAYRKAIAEHDSLRQQLEAAMKENEQLSIQLKESRDSRTLHAERHRKSTRRYAELKQKFEAAQKDHAQLIAFLDASQADYCAAADQRDSLRQQLEAAQKQLAEQEGYDGIAHDFEECKWKLAQCEADKILLIEDRARFPDKPDQIGNMIGAHFRSIKSAKERLEESCRWKDITINALRKKEEDLRKVIAIKAPAKSMRDWMSVFRTRKRLTDHDRELMDRMMEDYDAAIAAEGAGEEV